MATRQAEGRVAAGKYGRHLDDVTVRTGVGWADPAGSHDVFLDAWDELLGVGVQTAVNLVEKKKRDINRCVCVCVSEHVLLMLWGHGCVWSHCEDAPSFWSLNQQQTTSLPRVDFGHMVYRQQMLCLHG